MEPGYTARGRMTRRAFECGSLERVGEHVSIVIEHGAFIMRRHPAHHAGHLIRSCRTITEARRMAAAMARGERPERCDY